MRDKLVLLLLLPILFFSCSEEELPTGLYDYQVERLLSGTDGTKTWSQVVNSTNCTDSIKLVFDLIVDSSNDSLDVSITSGCAESLSTILIGRASASSEDDQILFTDSLNFADGTYWIVEQVTAEQLRLNIDIQSVEYVLK